MADIYIEEEKNAAIDAPKIKKDEYQPHKYVDDNFPFANIQGSFKCPYWIKCFLMEKYNLRDINKVISDFNQRDSHPAKVSVHFQNDIDLEPFTDYEYFLIKNKFTENKVIKTFEIISDEGENFSV